MSDVKERLADYAHEAWSGWMRHLFGLSSYPDSRGALIPGESVERWLRQMNTPYAELPESEKESDRAEADRMLAIFDAGHASLERELAEAREQHAKGCQCICHQYPEHDSLQNALEAATFANEQLTALRQRHAEAEAQTCHTCQHAFVGMAPAGRPHFTYCKRTKVPIPELGTQTYVECRELGMRCGAWLASEAKARLT